MRSARAARALGGTVKAQTAGGIMEKRRLGSGPLEVSSIGLGCMGMSFAYGAPEERDEAESIATIHRSREARRRRNVSREAGGNDPLTIG